MIMPSDKDYIETKQIMLGTKAIKPEFKPLADWIDMTYGVKTINIFYDTIDKVARPRLEICFEHPREKVVFVGKDGFNFDSGQTKGDWKEIRGDSKKTRFNSRKWIARTF